MYEKVYNILPYFWTAEVLIRRPIGKHFHLCAKLSTMFELQCVRSAYNFLTAKTANNKLITEWWQLQCNIQSILDKTCILFKKLADDFRETNSRFHI